MSIIRSGPPTTHDSVLWRVPLSGRPSAAWQKAFEGADVSNDARNPRRVQFEPEALTFRSDGSDVAEWVGSIDLWIGHANTAQADAEHARRDAADSAQARTDRRRQQANEANEKFKNL